MFLFAIIYACLQFFSRSASATYMKWILPVYFIVNISYKWAKLLDHHIKSMWLDGGRHRNKYISSAAYIYIVCFIFSLNNNKVVLMDDIGPQKLNDKLLELSYITWACGSVYDIIVTQLLFSMWVVSLGLRIESGFRAVLCLLLFTIIEVTIPNAKTKIHNMIWWNEKDINNFKKVYFQSNFI